MMPMMMRIMPTIAAGFIVISLQRPAALDQIDNQHYNRNDEQDMNESAQSVGADQSKQPQHQQDYKYCPEHTVPLRLSGQKFLPTTEKSSGATAMWSSGQN